MSYEMRMSDWSSDVCSSDLADGTAMHNRHVVICGNIQTDPKWANLSRLALDNHLQSCWSVPIISPGDKMLGTLSFYRESTHVPSSDEQNGRASCRERVSQYV